MALDYRTLAIVIEIVVTAFTMWCDEIQCYSLDQAINGRASIGFSVDKKHFIFPRGGMLSH